MSMKTCFNFKHRSRTFAPEDLATSPPQNIFSISVTSTAFHSGGKT